MKLIMYSFVALAFSTSVAQAQDAADTAEPPAPAAQGPAAPAAAAPAQAAAAAVSDSEIDSFAQATVKLQAIQADTSLADEQKQTKMQAAVTESGLDPAKYNAIGKAAQADPTLRDKVRTAMAKHAGKTEG